MNGYDDEPLANAQGWRGEGRDGCRGAALSGSESEHGDVAGDPGIVPREALELDGEVVVHAVWRRAEH